MLDLIEINCSINDARPSRDYNPPDRARLGHKYITLYMSQK